MTSIFKSNKFFRIIKHFILTIPLMVVLGTSIYTIVNPNAKDSFTDTTIERYEYETNQVVSVDDLKEGNIYHLSLVDFNTDFTGNLVCSDIFNFTSLNLSRSTYSSFTGVNFTPTQVAVYFEYESANRVNGRRSENSALINIDLDFVYLSSSNIDTLVQYISASTYLGELITETPFTLNNAFEYGMYSFTQVGFGKIDFGSLIYNIFNFGGTNLYIDFINSYINYYLFVECVYFAPWVIHAFIHFAYDLGDYFTSSFKRNRKEDD